MCVGADKDEGGDGGDGGDEVGECVGLLRDLKYKLRLKSGVVRGGVGSSTTVLTSHRDEALKDGKTALRGSGWAV